MLGLAGFSYVVGVLVVSVHLRQYGISSLGLSQLNYVIAGVWALVPVGLCVAFLILVGYGIALDADKPKKNIFGSVGAAIILIAFAVSYLSGYLGLHLGLINWLGIPVLGTVAAIMTAAAVYNLTQRDTYQNNADLAIGLGMVLVALFVSVFYVLVFASRTYNDIPAAIGGGSPTRVEFVVTAEAKSDLENIGIKFSAQNRTESLRLLQAAEKQYLIIGADGQTTAIPAEAVKLVIYEK